MDDLLGTGKANRTSDEVVKWQKGWVAKETSRRQAVDLSCYWSLCDWLCTTGYFNVAEACGLALGL
ncbi:hypothetical protein CTA2_8559 [Colletotrichum tanaceti]|uniref:Uncharacterized protein n=1 Tax=Colletotrichum tanaceti TaxID=1306861 RepID=A0A4U6XLN5_9PEZI|nr:hypothetical protein CTA2_8559 [Colletotrichum tanaceti]TKW56543.1 hypothetical protein CTA1_10613 [Colletotrichum tanaceti]